MKRLVRATIRGNYHRLVRPGRSKTLANFGPLKKADLSALIAFNSAPGAFRVFGPVVRSQVLCRCAEFLTRVHRAFDEVIRSTSFRSLVTTWSRGDHNALLRLRRHHETGASYSTHSLQIVPDTCSDNSSRYLLSCEGIKSDKSDFAFTVFETAFEDFGLPEAIRTDNGVAFASGNAPFRAQQTLPVVAPPRHPAAAYQAEAPATKRSSPTHAPDTQAEATRPPAFNFLQLQECFDAFVEIYNHARSKRCLPRRSIYTLSAPLPAARRARVSLSRTHQARNSLWPNLYWQTQNQSLEGFRRTGRVHPRDPRPDLAGQLPRQ